MATRPSRLEEFSAKIGILRQLEAELVELDERRNKVLRELDERRDWLRQTIWTTRSDLERRLAATDGLQLTLLPTPPDPPAPPIPTPPATAARARRHIEPWQPGQPIHPSVAAILRAFPPDGVLSFRQLQGLLPEMPYAVLRGRVGKARQYRLLDTAGWGHYRLAEHAKAAVLGGGLRVID